MARLFADITPLRQSPEFRRLWWGQGLASVGMMLTQMAVALQVYDLTQSTLMVGLVGGFSLVPVIVLGLYGGALADTYDRRRVALIASLVMWSATIGIALQAWLDLRQVALMYALVAIQAGANSVNGPARSAIIPRLVGLDHLPAALALNSLTFTFATLAGPMLGASLIAFIGYGPTYLIDVVTYTFSLYAVFRLPAMPPQRDGDAAVAGVAASSAGAGSSGSAGSSGEGEGAGASGDQPVGGWRSVVTGFAFLRTRRNLLMSFLTDMCAMILAWPRAAFAAAAVLIIGGPASSSDPKAWTVGILNTALAVGTTLASVLSGPLTRVRRQGRLVAVAVGAWGFGVATLGLVWVVAGRTSPDHIVWWALIASAVALAFAGAADSVSAIMRSTILQTATPDALRGRLQGVFIVVVTGGPRLGELVNGIGSRLHGEGWAVLIGGLACIAAVFLLTRWHKPFLAYDARHPEA
ncbi:MAG: MFS transporter [Propionibacteriaceae bacterium]|nr:MFS transporter [Propionibacteriaceae bacterium]